MENKALPAIATRLNAAFAIIILFLLFGLVGQSDYEEELAAQRHYCNMVESGAWPPFNPETNCDMESGK
jgi:hypothetical protein